MLEKIKKHGVAGSLKIIGNKLNEVPDLLKVKFAQQRSYDGVIVKNIQGSSMILDIKDVGISHELLLTGVHESESTKQIRSEIKPGMNILEVGANIGYYLLIESKLIGDQGRIYAFEPSPVNMRMLKANIALNNIDNLVTTYPHGVGNEAGMQKFYIMSKGNMSSFITRAEDRIIKTRDHIDVEIIRVDDFFKEEAVQFDYVRMDVEGYELEVLKGMQNILTSENSPRGMFIEVHSELLNKIADCSCESFLGFMKGMGYGIKVSRFRGRDDIKVHSTEEMMQHPNRELGYWEAFFEKKA